MLIERSVFFKFLQEINIASNRGQIVDEFHTRTQYGELTNISAVYLFPSMMIFLQNSIKQNLSHFKVYQVKLI